MADNVTFTTPSFAAATDEVTGTLEHVQLMKLAIATDGSRTLIPADGTDGLLVNLGANNDVSLNAGTNNIGDVDVLSIAAGDNNIGNVDIVTVPAPLSTTGGGTEATALRVTVASDSTGVLSVDDNGGALTVDNGGTFAVQADGSIAHDTADSGSPVKIGAKAEASTAGVTLVADADRTDLYADLDGVLITKPYTAYGDILVERLSNTDGASTASTVFGATASARNCITTIAVHNSSATNGFIDFRDGTAGTILFTLPLPAYGGAVVTFPVPLRQTTANTAFAYDVSAAITTVYISLVGFKSKA